MKTKELLDFSKDHMLVLWADVFFGSIDIFRGAKNGHVINVNYDCDPPPFVMLKKMETSPEMSFL